MDDSIPPLMDWNQINDALKLIIGELQELTESHLSLVSRVKDIEERLPPPERFKSSFTSDSHSQSQGWDTPDPVNDPDNLMSFSNPSSPRNSMHIPLNISTPSQQSGVDAPPFESKLASLTAMVTSLGQNIQQGMALQSKYLAARGNDEQNH
jgi:hypothetical protein